MWLLFIFKWIIHSTIIGSILAFIILLVKFIFKERLGVRWNYCVWFLLLVRLIIPYAPQSSASIFNVFYIAENKLFKNEICENNLLNIELSHNKLVNEKVHEEDYILDSSKVKPMNKSTYKNEKSILEYKDKLRETNKNKEVNYIDKHKENKTISSRFYDSWTYFHLIAFLWVIGVIILGTYIISVNVKFRLKLANKSKCRDAETLELLKKCKLKMNLKYNIEVLNTDLVKTPAIFGVIKPKLLLPTNIKKQITCKELQYVIFHEISHVKRKDILVNCITSILSILHWFNPIIWYSFYVMRDDRELACDAFALSHINSNEYISYGHTIIKLLENYKKTSYLYGVTCIINNKSGVKRRIVMISLFKKNSYKWSIISIIALIVMGVVMLTNPRNNSVLATKEKDKKIIKEEKGNVIDRSSKKLLNREIIHEVNLQYNKYLSPVEKTTANDIIVTLDNNIQSICEKAAEKALKDNKSKAVSILVMNPNNGEILSMVNKYAPSLKHNNREIFENRIISDSFEPGSMFKCITAAVALNEKVINPDSYEVLCNGETEVNNTIIRCWSRDGHGKQSFDKVLLNSCNIGFMDLGKKIGAKRFNKYNKAFGFGQKTGIDLPKENSGVIKNTKEITDMDLATISFGQTNTVTPIQYLTAFNTLANGGTWIRPHVMKEILQDEDGKKEVYKKFNDYGKKQILNKTTADAMKNYLEMNVSGNGKYCMEGYNIGSKTGTSQKSIDGRYEKGKYICNYVGMASPKEGKDTKFTILISIDEPDPKNYYAEKITNPIVEEIFNNIFDYYAVNKKSK
ncbi:beta-lactamase regulating signal transducer with metallopeptidase domain [Clostridium tetanomorphum]|uniref:M56 family metallopeptidase n=1 Tax=Clostridium tetanomorphum TaxID=1553 RepID=UPI00044CFF3B|nr:M56 family metallopeptidase [Clostridium tetanomorphum]KAJ49828.1 stage V sporulation protein D [Clostridium tetanomorphum DSM 665]MBP1865130.1 beta-lactamase regulating signal transducer with metallopeptidase domain [Clostridium tetanomorphum]NRS84731.1 beta-lactamase regulating signal transducer with metallopeptidase domain [Clostridium tetanomorphum]